MNSRASALRPYVAWLPTASVPTLTLATLFFVVSLTPGLVPRNTLVQAVLSGVSLAAGHAIGLILSALWYRLEFPALPHRLQARLNLATVLLCLVVAMVALWQASEWQNGLRAVMETPPVDTVRPISIAAGAAAVFLLLVWFARLSWLVVIRMAGALARLLPGPQAFLVAITLTALLFWNIGNGVLVRAALSAADRVYAGLDVRSRSPVHAPRIPQGPARPARCWTGSNWGGPVGQ